MTLKSNGRANWAQDRVGPSQDKSLVGLPPMEQMRVLKLRQRGLEVDLKTFEGTAANGEVKYQVYADKSMDPGAVKRIVAEVEAELKIEFPEYNQTSELTEDPQGSPTGTETDDVLEKMLESVEHATEHLSWALAKLSPQEKALAHAAAEKLRDNVIALIDETRGFLEIDLRSEQFKIAVDVAGLLAAFQYVRDYACAVEVGDVDGDEGSTRPDIQKLISLLQDEMMRGTKRTRQ